MATAIIRLGVHAVDDSSIIPFSSSMVLFRDKFFLILVHDSSMVTLDRIRDMYN